MNKNSTLHTRNAISLTLYTYANSNDLYTIGNVVQEKLSMVFKQSAKERPLSMIGLDTDQTHRGLPL